MPQSELRALAQSKSSMTVTITSGIQKHKADQGFLQAKGAFKGKPGYVPIPSEHSWVLNNVQLSGGFWFCPIYSDQSPRTCRTHITRTHALWLFSDTLGELKCTLQCKLVKLLPNKRQLFSTIWWMIDSLLQSKPCFLNNVRNIIQYSVFVG